MIAFDEQYRLRSAPGCKICGSAVRELYTVSNHTIWKCSSCQFGQVWIDDADLAAFYDEDYFSGEKAPFSQAKDQPIRPAVSYWLEHYLKLIGLERPLSVLEIGPGPSSAVGRYLRQHYRGVTYEAVEISSYAANCLAEEGLVVYSGRITDPEILDKCRGRFDLVLGTEVIEHDPNPIGFADAVYEMLKRGGRCAFSTGNLNGMVARRRKSSWYYIAPPAHLSYYCPKSAKTLFEKSGFVEVTTWRSGFNYIELQMKYRIPGILLLSHLLSLSTGMTISAVRPAA